MAAAIQTDELVAWPTLDKSTLLDRLGLVVMELFGAYQELGMLEAAEVQAKAQAFARADYESVTARDREARQASLPNSIAVMEVTRRIEALQEAKQFAYFLLEMS